MNRPATIDKLRRLAIDPGATEPERQVAGHKADLLEAGMPPAPPRPPAPASAAAPEPIWRWTSTTTNTANGPIFTARVHVTLNQEPYR